ncbi:hypothetical protein B0T16DRAFT_496455 [Cercophora newfieldiana]|uniref:Nucleoside-diphosphate-sugar epimerase n=1 Tax=Cercophora newfieldiana TaxID=92897 RepID=A0AA39XX19_9PEZI|nr:hypothetical protein B0T16DRAFT_496455 [Cercophora newfieldiana]
MHLILTGATGLVGSAVLDAMIKTQTISKISILSRRPVPMADDAHDPRINVIIHKDFNTYDKALLEQLQDATGCVWALGISQASVGKEDYIQITKSYPLAFASAFQTLPPRPPTQPFNFVYVSALGATLTPGRFTSLFGRVKGETEILLGEMRKANPSFRATSVRPAFVNSCDHDAIKGYKPALGMARTVAEWGFTALARIKPSLDGPTEPLGRFMTEVAMGGWDGRLEGEGVEKLDGGMDVVENFAFRRLVGLDK